MRNAATMDVTGSFEGPHDVVVVDGHIEALGRSVAGGQTHEAVSLDLDGLWLMPGVVDCHAHLACFKEDALAYLGMSTTRWALECAGSAKRLLDQGVTLARDPGGADAGIRDAIADGLVPGPTMLVAIAALSQTGGHGDGFLAGLGVEMSNSHLMHEYPARPPTVADGVEGVRLAIRKIVRADADWIKICTTGGLLSPGVDHPESAEFTRDEIAAILDEATRLHKPVMAHAYGGSGLTDAVECGVRSIEHGSRLTEEQAALMARSETFLVPTLTVLHELVDLRDAGRLTQPVSKKVTEIEPVIGEAVRIAQEAGVQIAAGTDKTVQDGLLAEISHLARAGLSVEQALLSATAVGAAVCGQSDVRGDFGLGKICDAIVLKQDPSDPDVFLDEDNVVGVIQGGRIHRWSGDAERLQAPKARPAATRHVKRRG
jgi:imidazolonepropionase-like amidohydrolase